MMCTGISVVDLIRDVWPVCVCVSAGHLVNDCAHMKMSVWGDLVDNVYLMQVSAWRTWIVCLRVYSTLLGERICFLELVRQIWFPLTK